MRLTAHDYIALMERLGLFSVDKKLPEQNSAVWRHYLDLYAAHAGKLEDIEIIATPSGMGFYCDPLMGEENWAWALTSPLSHPVLPFTAAQILAAAGEIEKLFAQNAIPLKNLITDSFVFATPPEKSEENCFPWVNSPLARFAPTFEHYVEGLTAPRRKQCRRLYRQYNDDPAIRFDFTQNSPDAAEFAFITSNTTARWVEEAPFALVQTLWVMATAAIMPEQTRFMRVYQGDDLVFFNSYLIRDGIITSQATCRSEKHHLSGLGVMIDFKTIELMTASGTVHALDPTCITSYVDQGSILVAKREVINEECLRPLFCLRTDEVEGAPRFENGTWQPTAEKLIIGKGV